MLRFVFWILRHLGGLADLGTTAPSRVSGFLQAHCDVQSNQLRAHTPDQTLMCHAQVPHPQSPQGQLPDQGPPQQPGAANSWGSNQSIPGTPSPPTLPGPFLPTKASHRPWPDPSALWLLPDAGAARGGPVWGGPAWVAVGPLLLGTVTQELFFSFFFF